MRFRLIHIFQVKIQPSLGGIYLLICGNSTGRRREKKVPTKVGVRYPVQMLEDIKGVLDASTDVK